MLRPVCPGHTVEPAHSSGCGCLHFLAPGVMVTPPPGFRLWEQPSSEVGFAPQETCWQPILNFSSAQTFVR
jgi:hypothetical protein